MDGRIQEPIIAYMKNAYAADYVDAVTEAGPPLLLDENAKTAIVDNVHARVEISRTKHGSKVLAVSGHHDCAGDPVDEATQLERLKRVVSQLRERYPSIEVVCLYVDGTWSVRKIDA